MFSILKSKPRQISGKLEDAVDLFSFLSHSVKLRIAGPILQALERGSALLKCMEGGKKPTFIGNTL